MIRRDDRSDWLLIRQVEHAHIAGEIAAAWGNENTEPLPKPELLVPAIYDHDNGWQNWARSPQIDPETGRPRNFTEMPMVDATAIWTPSIEACRKQHPLAGIWVSRHFCHLAENARENRIDESEERAAIEHFLAEQSQKQQQWKQQASADFPADELEPLIETGFRYVQFFDRISLWLCCEPATRHYTTSSPGGQSLRFTQQPDGSIAVDPFPLRKSPLELSVMARRIPARKYRDDAELNDALQTAATERLRWKIVTG